MIKRYICAVIAAALALQSPAFAQLLPSDPLQGLDEKLLEPVERQIESSVENALEEQILTAPSSTIERLDDIVSPQIIDALPEVVAPLAQTDALPNLLNTLRDVLPPTVPTILAPDRPIDIDRDGDWPVLRDEWVALIDNRDVAKIQSLTVEIIEQTQMLSTDKTLFTLRVRSDSRDATRAEDILQELGAERVDRNYIYRGAASPADINAATAPATQRGGFQPGKPTLGLIDTSVDRTHPGLSNLDLHSDDFVTLKGTRPQAHGTAVASLLARHSPTGASVLSASVFFLSDNGQTGASTASLIKALDWMMANEVPIINFSLTGPPDRALQQMVKLSLARGTVIVAAVGNGGPAAPPQYPAAYDGVIGVTAVDKDGEVYRWANRGSYVDIAALGVGVSIAVPGGGWTQDSGTSLAAPVITANLAQSDGAPPSFDNMLVNVAHPRTASKRQTVGAGVFASETE